MLFFKQLRRIASCARSEQAGALNPWEARHPFDWAHAARLQTARQRAHPIVGRLVIALEQT
jgi:hypothetical protein